MRRFNIGDVATIVAADDVRIPVMVTSVTMDKDGARYGSVIKLIDGSLLTITPLSAEHFALEHF